jgi:hypothetical protein
LGGDTGDRWAYRLRAFVSVDLVESTAFKAGGVERLHPSWVEAFEAFFCDFPGELSAQYTALLHPPSGRRRSAPGAGTAQLAPGSHGAVSPVEVFPRLSPWKFNGDEIIYSVQLMYPGDLFFHLRAVQLASASYTEKGARNRRKPRLRTKLAGWLAGFPVTNRQVVLALAEAEPGERVVDYLGPGIDTGFRLAKVADETRFVLSVEMALMLLDVAVALKRTDECPIFYSGRQYLKGVAAGGPYPDLWLAAPRALAGYRAEARVLGRSTANSDLREFLCAYVSETPGMVEPFIKIGDDLRYGAVPEEIERERDRLMAEDSIRRATGEEPAREGEPAAVRPPRRKG